MLICDSGSLIILHNRYHSICTSTTITSGNISKGNIVIKRKYLLPSILISNIGTTPAITRVLIHIQILVFGYSFILKNRSLQIR